MMIIINRIGDVISGSVNGKPFGVTYSEEKWQAMQQLKQKADSVDTMDELKAIVDEFIPLTQESYKELVEHKTPYLMVNRYTNKFYLKYQDKVSSQPLPQVFVDKIVASVEKNIDITPLIKCWARYMRPVPGRPAYSVERARLFAQYIDSDYTDHTLVEEHRKNGLSDSVATTYGTVKQVAITQEGLLVCYKVSREILKRYELNDNEEVVEKSRYGKEIDPDTGLVTYKKPEYVEERLFEPYVMGNRGDEFFCGAKKGHFIKVGELHALESWDQVSAPGHKGLHCGGLRYIQGYQNEGTVTHNIFVDPMHIHSIAGLGIGSDGAMTVKQYFVHSSFAGPNRNIYHSSKYAALTDTEFAKIVEEAVEATKAKVEELQAMQAEVADLIDKPAVTAADVLGS